MVVWKYATTALSWDSRAGGVVRQAWEGDFGGNSKSLEGWTALADARIYELVSIGFRF